MPVTPHSYQAVLDEHRRRLDRLIDRRGVAAVKRIYDQAQAEMVRKITRMAPRSSQSFTAYQRNLILAQIRQGQALMARRLAGEIGDLSKEAQTEALRGIEGMLATLEKQYRGTTPVLPTVEASRFAGVVDAKRTSLLVQHNTSVARYGSDLIGKMENQMSMGLVQNETSGETIDRIESTADVSWAGAERIVRTEGAWAMNGSAADGMAAAREVLPDLEMRWSEHVDVASGAPLDRRVAVDSMAMDGQLAIPGAGVFTMPSTAPRGTLDKPGDVDVPDGLVGRSWAYPPDRPNDRAVCAPWRSGWGIVGWHYVDGRRVYTR